MALDVLIVEDHEDLREEIIFFLKRQGMQVRAVGSAPAMDAAMAERLPDIVVLDLGLTGEDGISVARRLAAGPRPGVVVITARGRVEDRILGLTVGADIYLVKPIDLRELEAAIHSVARRRAEPPRGEQPWRLDPMRRQLVAPTGQAAGLTELELRFLSIFFEMPGSTIDRASLSERVAGDPRGIDLLVHRLRRKVESDTGAVLPLRTVMVAAMACGC